MAILRVQIQCFVDESYRLPSNTVKFQYRHEGCGRDRIITFAEANKH